MSLKLALTLVDFRGNFVFEGIDVRGELLEDFLSTGREFERGQRGLLRVKLCLFEVVSVLGLEELVLFLAGFILVNFLEENGIEEGSGEQLSVSEPRLGKREILILKHVCFLDDLLEELVVEDLFYFGVEFFVPEQFVGLEQFVDESLHDFLGFFLVLFLPALLVLRLGLPLSQDFRHFLLPLQKSLLSYYPDRRSSPGLSKPEGFPSTLFRELSWFRCSRLLKRSRAGGPRIPFSKKRIKFREILPRE